MIDQTLNISLCIVLMIVAICLAIVGKNWLQAIARNPEAASQLFVPAITVLSFIEICGFIAAVFILIK